MFEFIAALGILGLIAFTAWYWYKAGYWDGKRDQLREIEDMGWKPIADKVMAEHSRLETFDKEIG